MSDGGFLTFFLDEAADILAGWEKSCLEYEQSSDLEAAESLYRGAHNLKSGSAAVNLMELRDFVHRVEDLIAKVIAKKVAKSPRLVHFLLETQSVLLLWIDGVRREATFVPTLEKERAVLEITALLDDETDESQQATPAANEGERQPQGEQKSAAPLRSTGSLRVAAGKLDTLVQLVGELSTQQAIIWHARQNHSLSSKSCDNAIQLIQKNAKDLQALALSMRMQPLQSLFQRLERAARDLARAQNKKLDVVTFGDDVELDRAVVERITEAMMHVIRNAVDHGIEESDARVEQGKGGTATLRIEGRQDPGGVLISVGDDGRGLNLERILAKAIEKQLASPDEKYSPAEIQRFIFLQGFSTAHKVTDVSGRGVGMDVVKRAVEAIGGGITVTSTKGKGTTFSILLPTTLSIVDALIIRIGPDRYAAPLSDVSEIIDLAGFHLQTASSRGRLLSLREAIVPVEHLSDHLPTGSQSIADKPPSGRTLLSKAHSPKPDDLQIARDSIKPALLVRSGLDAVAFEVDRIEGQQPVAMRRLPIVFDRIAATPARRYSEMVIPAFC